MYQKHQFITCAVTALFTMREDGSMETILLEYDLDNIDSLDKIRHLFFPVVINCTKLEHDANLEL